MIDLKKIKEVIPTAVINSIKSFIIMPQVVIFSALMISSDFNPSIASKIFEKVTSDDLMYLWTKIGWLSFFAFIGWDFLKNSFKRERRGKYFQMPLFQIEGETLDENAKFISHGVCLENKEKIFFEDLISQEEADLLNGIFKK